MDKITGNTIGGICSKDGNTFVIIHTNFINIYQYYVEEINFKKNEKQKITQKKLTIADDLSDIFVFDFGTTNELNRFVIALGNQIWTYDMTRNSGDISEKYQVLSNDVLSIALSNDTSRVYVVEKDKSRFKLEVLDNTLVDTNKVGNTPNIL